MGKTLMFRLYLLDKTSNGKFVAFDLHHATIRAVARALIGGGGVYSYIQVLTD